MYRLVIPIRTPAIPPQPIKHGSMIKEYPGTYFSLTLSWKPSKVVNISGLFLDVPTAVAAMDALGALFIVVVIAECCDGGDGENDGDDYALVPWFCVSRDSVLLYSRSGYPTNLYDYVHVICPCFVTTFWSKHTWSFAFRTFPLHAHQLSNNQSTIQTGVRVVESWTCLAKRRYQRFTKHKHTKRVETRTTVLRALVTVLQVLI